MAAVGTAFKVTGAGYHLWVVISKPNNDGNVVCVNLTDSNNYLDSTCHLQVGDHEFITKSSAVMYKKARLWREADIAKRIRSGQLTQYPDLRPEIIKQIIDGALCSDDLSPFLHVHIKPIV